MGEFSKTIISILHSVQSVQKREAPDQGGLLTGKDPSAFNTTDPLRLWIIQVGVIVGMASLLSVGLRQIRQPKVIAEVLGGILLGPTAFGRIPGFTEHVFPSQSIPYLTLVANIGLCLFLFLVGLEIDMSIIRRNAKLSATVALAGMIIPFGAGAGLAVPLYKIFIDTPESGLAFVKFTYFMLFTGVAYSITAFPVLCRILTELKLLDTTVGVVVLSAGVANDIIGWTLLALSVALVNAGSGLTALYILLVCVAWALLLLIPGKKALLWLARKTGSTDGHGPTMFFMTATMLLVFGSAFFTDVIGVHAIFGAFIAGIIVPREGNLAIHLTEKLEDMVTIVFLPLYFTLSGLSTNLGLLNNGITWGYTIAICTLAFVGKFGGCFSAARFIAGFSWRESGAIGALMSCKGLVELIVLNVGLSAGILSQRVFSMFVLEALLLTFMTTPLVTVLYPPEFRVRVAATGANFNNVADKEVGRGPTSSFDGQDRKRSTSSSEGSTSDCDETMKLRFTVVLDKIEHLPGMMALTQLLKPSLVSCFQQQQRPLPSPAGPSQPGSSRDLSTAITPTPPTLATRPTSPKMQISLDRPAILPLSPSSSHNISALRLIELSDRTSAVMKSMAAPHEASVLSQTDPILSIYTTFGSLNDLNVTPALETVPYDDLARTVVDFAQEEGKIARLNTSGKHVGGEMILLPWLPPALGHGNGNETHVPASPASIIPHINPFDALFGNRSGSGTATPAPGGNSYNVIDGHRSTATDTHAHFVRHVFSNAKVDVGLFMDLGSANAGVGASIGGLPIGRGQPSSASVQHVILPFFGGPDDRLALAFVAQLCENERVEATCLRITKKDVDVDDPTAVPEAHLDNDPDNKIVPPPESTLLTVASALSARSAVGASPGMTAFPDTVYGHANTATRMQSETADHLAWSQYANPSSDPTTASAFPSRAALARMTFQDLASPVPLHAIIAEANKISASARPGLGPGPTRAKLLIVVGRSRRLAVESHTKELKGLVEEYHATLMRSEVKKTIGDVASACVVAGCAQEVMVVQAATSYV